MDTITAPQSLATAIRQLAGVCDYAQTADGQGFDGQDAVFGHRLAALDADTWTDDMVVEAVRLARKYQRQIDLEAALTDVAPELLARAATQTGTNHTARTQVRDRVRHSQRRATVVDGRIAITTEYDSELVAEQRDLPGRRWDGARKVNLVDPSPEALTWLLRRHVTIDEAAEALLTAAPTAPATPAAPNVTIEGRSLVVTTPYSADLTSALRSVPGRRWNGQRKVNTVPVTSWPQLLDVVQAFGLTVADDVRNAVTAAETRAAENTAGSRAETAEYDGPLAADLYPYQRAGVAYALRTRRALIADEMGLGKTRQAIATLEAAGAYPALVVCPATLRGNWGRELASLVPDRAGAVVKSASAKRDVEAARNAEIVVVSYEAAGKIGAVVEGLRGLVIDESHYIKTGKSQRTKAVKALAKSVPADGVVLALTGTPILNRPVELVSQLEALGVIDDLGGSWGFRQRYCDAWQDRFGWHFDGASHLDELNDKLRATCMVRRLRADVLPDLPTTRRMPVTLELNGALREYRTAERDLIGWLHSVKGELAADAALRSEALVKLGALRQLAGLAKIDAVVEQVDELLDSRPAEKVVVFAWHREVQEALAAHWNAPHLAGGMAAADVEAAKARFTEGDARVIVCSLNAAAEGHTLVAGGACSTVVMAELGWTPGRMQQAEDRVNRIGQTAAHVEAWYMLAADTVDETLHELLAEKRAVAEAAIDGGDPVDAGAMQSALLAALSS